MKIRANQLFLVCLLAMLLASLPACTLFTGTSAPRTALSNQQAAAIIAVNAVPSINYYLKEAGQSPINYPVSATGEWNAVYRDDGTWRVEGQVVAKYPSGDKNCSTAWTLSEVDGTIKLVKFVCE